MNQLTAQERTAVSWLRSVGQASSNFAATHGIRPDTLQTLAERGVIVREDRNVLPLYRLKDET